MHSMHTMDIMDTTTPASSSIVLIKGLSKNHPPKGPCERPALRSSMASPGEILLVRAKSCGACPPSLLSAAGGFGEGDGFTASVLGQLDGSTGTLVVSLFFYIYICPRVYCRRLPIDKLLLQQKLLRGRSYSYIALSLRYRSLQI